MPRPVLGFSPFTSVSQSCSFTGHALQVCKTARLSQLTARLVSPTGRLNGILSLTQLKSSSPKPVLPQLVSRHLLRSLKVRSHPQVLTPHSWVLGKSWRLHLQKYQNPSTSVSMVTTLVPATVLLTWAPANTTHLVSTLHFGPGSL